MTQIKLIAHRGASSEAPENTLASIQKALSLGIDFIDIEIDVHLSKDFVAIVMHDDFTDRTTRGSKERRAITEMTLEEIKALDAGSWFGETYVNERIPTLMEVLSLNFGTAGIMIELKKSPFPAEKVASVVMEVLSQVNRIERLLIGSFEPDLLDAIHKLDPTLKLIYIVEDLNRLESFNNKLLAIDHKLLTKDLMEDLINKHKEIWSFTVDSPHRAQELIKYGVTGIITNNPRYIQRFLG
jgi:glycerophosphoryl diester phosphodiesterase